MLTDPNHPIGGMVAWLAIFFFLHSAVRYIIARRHGNVPRRIYHLSLMRGNAALFFCGQQMWASEVENLKNPRGGSALTWFTLLCIAIYYLCSARGRRKTAEGTARVAEVQSKMTGLSIKTGQNNDPTVWPPPPTP